MTRPIQEWTVSRTTPEGGYEFECLRCGEKYQPALPIPLSMFVALCKTFARDHRGCKETPR